jgi:hypothetical protein
VSEWQVVAELIYGQVKKSYRRRKLVRVTPVMRLGTQDALTVALQRLGFSGRLNTAFIERVNLTVCHGVAALARRNCSAHILSITKNCPDSCDADHSSSVSLPLSSLLTLMYRYQWKEDERTQELLSFLLKKRIIEGYEQSLFALSSGHPLRKVTMCAL